MSRRMVKFTEVFEENLVLIKEHMVQEGHQKVLPAHMVKYMTDAAQESQSNLDKIIELSGVVSKEKDKTPINTPKQSVKFDEDSLEYIQMLSARIMAQNSKMLPLHKVLEVLSAWYVQDQMGVYRG